MSEIFKKDRKHWTISQQEQIDYFFRFNQFFTKFYEQVYLQDFIQMSFYAKISPNSSLYLTDNKRPAAIILLKGNVAVFKREFSEQKRQKKNQNIEQFRKITELLRYNQTLVQSSQCKVTALHDEQAEILFVPTYIYHKFLHKCKEQKDEITFEMLRKIFKRAQNKDIMELAKSGCKVKQLRINNYIYEQGDKPQSVYVVVEGSVKIQRPGFTQKPYDIVVVSTDSLVGQKDIYLSQRQSSAICCSAFVRLIEIPKESFLRFAKISLPDLKMSQSRQNSLSPSKSKKQSAKVQLQGKLPLIMRFRSASKKSQEEEERQYKLIKNSHILLDATRPSKYKIRSRSSFSDYPKDMLQQKIKLYKKIRPNVSGIDLTNRIF